jgi:hypothetical protein
MKYFLASIALFVGTAIVSADEPSKPFDGGTLKGWKFRGSKDKSKWDVGVAALDKKDPAKIDFRPKSSPFDSGELVNTSGGSVDIFTETKYGDCVIEVEVMVPKGSNSGIYLMGEFEVQVFDSFGKDKVGPGDMGGIYNTAAPKVNASKKPGEWQKFVIEFQAPKFSDGKKTANAKFLKVTLNDQVIHENVEVKGPTTSALTGKEAATGPLLFQGDHGPVAYRNLVVKPSKN